MRRETVDSVRVWVNRIMFNSLLPECVSSIILFKYCGWDEAWVYWQFECYPEHGPTPVTSDNEDFDEDGDAGITM